MEDGEHITKKYMNNFSGNFMFASTGSCQGFNKSRRDDIQSLLLFMIYLLTGQLPWSHVSYKDSESMVSCLNYRTTKEVVAKIPDGLPE